jgi:hypothetical protein
MVSIMESARLFNDRAHSLQTSLPALSRLRESMGAELQTVPEGDGFCLPQSANPTSVPL